MRIAHNIEAINTERHLNIASTKQGKSAEKLSSGYKINRAADNAAGLGISEKMRRIIRGLDRGADNIQEGVGLCQIADGALNETLDMLQRINVLAVQAANGTNSDSDRESIQDEIAELKCEIDRIAETTNFNEAIYPLRGGKTVSSIIQPMKKESYHWVEWDKVVIGGMDTETNVGWNPFGEGDEYDHLGLQAIIDDVNDEYAIKNFDLIFGQGSTSQSSIRLKDMNQIMII